METGAGIVAVRRVETPWSRRGQQRAHARFLKAVPLPLLQKAARLPGRALALYLAIRHQSDLRRGQTVTLSAAYLRDWGISRYAQDRGLVVLETVDLITVERRPGHPARVTVVDGAAKGRHGACRAMIDATEKGDG